MKRIMIATGEASGDIHGAKVINAVRRLDPEVEFLGVGGRQMEAAGCQIIIPSEELAVMGLVEVLGHLPVVWRSLRQLKQILNGPQRPDALLLIDSPEFNLRLAKHAHNAGVPVLYYVSPQVWAWRRGRVKKIASVVDKLAAIFPFEPDFYKGQDIDVRYVGHPLLDEVKEQTSRQLLLSRYKIDPQKPVVGLFPGSRRNELKFMLDTLVKTARQLQAKKPNIHFLVPVASTLTEDEIAQKFPAELPISFVSSDESSIYDVANACDAIITVSGTVTLQIALVGTPMVIFYKLAPLSYAIGKRLIKVDHIGLANIVAEKQVVKEFIQHDATADNLSEETLKLLDQQDYNDSVRQELSRLQSKLGAPGCSMRVAEMLLSMTNKTSGESISRHE